MSQEREPSMGEMDFRMPSRQRLEQGEVVKGTVVLVSDGTVFLDVGGKSEATLDAAEVTDDDGNVKVQVGDKLEAYVVQVEPEVVLSHAMARAHLNLGALEDAHDLGIPVQGKVTGVNKGGVEVDLGGTRGFCPVSQIELGYCEDPSAYLEQTYEFKVIEIREGGRNVVVSRRALLEQERAEAAEALQDQLFEGAELSGEVVSLQDYGAFVDIGGVQGLVHISEIAHGHLAHPSEALAQGQQVRVKVLKITQDPKRKDRQRIGLSIRALLGDPWDEAAEHLTEGGTVEGTVVRLQPFGAFVEVAPGVDGLVHISELADRRVSHPGDVVEVGQQVTATVLKVDRPAKRLSLSLRGGAALAVDGGGAAATGGGGSGRLAVGDVVDVTVGRIKPFGLLVNVKGGGRDARGLIPVEEIPGGRGTSLNRTYPEGTELKVTVASVDPNTGRIRFSIKGYEEAKERQDYKAYMSSSSADRPARPNKGKAPSAGTNSGSSGFGTLGDLLQDVIKKDK